MENVKEVKILTTRIGPRAYDVEISYDDFEEVREFDNVNNAFAAHTVFREFIYNNPKTKINLKTNVNALIGDIETLETNPRTLTRYLRSVLEESGSQIVSVEYESIK